MKRLVKYLSVASLLAFCGFLAFGDVQTIYTQANVGGLVTEAMQLLANNNTWDVAVNRHGYAPAKPSASPTLFLNAANQWVSPINSLGLTSGRIPLAFTSGLGTFVDAEITQDFTGNVTFVGSHDVTFSQATVNTIAYFDASRRLKSVTLGSNLTLIGGVLDTTTGGGNVSATVGSGYNGTLAFFDADNGTHVNKIPNSNWNGTQLTINGAFQLTGGNANFQNDVAIGGNLTVGGGSVTGASSGVYAPTVTPISNCDLTAVTAHNLRWVKVGNVVRVNGEVEIRQGAGAASFRFTLPYPSNLAATDDLTGTATFYNSPASYAASTFVSRMKAETINEAALVNFTGGATANILAVVDFSYTVN